MIDGMRDHIARSLRMAFWAGALGMFLVLAGCAGQAASTERFVGTWDLVSGESSENAGALTAENIELMKALGVDSYLVLQGDGVMKLVTLDEAKTGTWHATSDTAGAADIEGRSTSITTNGSTLKLVQAQTTLVFTKGEPRQSESDMADRALGGGGTRQDPQAAGGLSEEVVSGRMFDAPIEVASDRLCTIEVDGTGIDTWGDLGLNLRIANAGDEPIDVWTNEPSMVNGMPVSAYLYATVPARSSATAFLQLDAAQLRAAGITRLANVTGDILVDDENDVTLKTYSFNLRLPA